MKTILLSLLSLVFITATFGQCVPIASVTGSSFAFTPSEQLDPVYACAGCGDAERSFSLQTFADTTLTINLSPGNPPVDISVFADFFRLDSIAGLPEGLTYTTDAAFDTTYDAVLNPFGYWINAGDTASGFTQTTGCITINGSEADWIAAANGGPNNDGYYPLSVFIDARAANFYPAAIGNVTGFDTWLTEMGNLLPAFGDPNFTENGIQYAGPGLQVYESGVGVNENELDVFGNVSNSPNPFNEQTAISFTLEKAENINLSVYNLLGSQVGNLSFSASVGKNSIDFDAQNLPSGVYIYTLSNGINSVTKRMNVQ